MFDALHTASSGLTLHRTWLEAVSDNVANINTVRPADEPAFQERFVVAEALPSEAEGGAGGVRVAGTLFGDAEGRLAFDPNHPMADENGDIRLPDIDLADQMVSMMVAQRGYQANLATVERARNAYEAALQIGR